jgi:hypothetical protein
MKQIKEYVGDKNITDGDRERYQKIAENIAATAAECGSDRSKF